MLTGWPLLLWFLRRLRRQSVDLFHALIRDLRRVLGVLLAVKQSHRGCPYAELS